MPPRAKKGKAPVKKAASASNQKRGKDVFEADAETYMKRLRKNLDDDGDVSDDDAGLRVRRQDDEDVDDDGDDIGWDSDDDLAYGQDFSNRGSKYDESESDQEELEDGEMLLSDLIGSKTKSKASSSSSSSSSLSKSKAKKQQNAMDEDENEDESDFEYDYEDKLKDKKRTRSSSSSSSSSKGDSNSGSDSNLDSDDDDDDEEDDDDELEDVHKRLLSAIDRFAQPQGKTSSSSSSGTSSQSRQNVSENAYSSVAESWTNVNNTGKSNNNSVTMDALLGALDGENGINIVKSKLLELEKGLSTVPVYVEKVHSDRAERVLAYDGSQKEMSKWQNIVNSNRNARTLDIAQDQKIKSNYKDLIRKHEPSNDMEKEISMILVKTGATEKQVEDNENDDLGNRNLSIDELRQRQADLAKTRALLFYEQMKRHRINKIKSKAYHRIKKRQRVKKGQEEMILAENDPELLLQLKEDAAMKRVKERMSLRHKSTSKFAQEMLKHGHGNKSMREAFNESVMLGNELQESIQSDPTAKGTGDNDDDDDDDDSDDSDNNLPSAKSGKRKQKLAAAKANKALKKAGLLQQNDNDDDNDDDVVDGKYKKLFEMDFMKKAREQQKERAREEAQSVLREIEDMEDAAASDDSGNDDNDDDDEEERKKKSKNKAKEIAEAKKKMENLFGKSKGVALKGKKVMFNTENNDDDDNDNDNDNNDDKEDKKSKKSSSLSKKSANTSSNENAVVEESNPWLNPSTANKRSSKSTKDAVHAALDGLINKDQPMNVNNNSNSNSNSNLASGKTKKSKMVAVKSKSSVNVNEQTSATSSATATTTTTTTTTTNADNKDEKKKSLLNSRPQQDLVSMAFAGPDLEDEFQLYKNKTINDELGIDDKKKKILLDVKAGWGDWAGPGETMISEKILNKRDKLMKAADNDAEIKRNSRLDTKTPNVILSDRRIKTAAKFKIADIPHPFTTRAEYEKSLTMPIGEEWNATHVVRQNTKPDIFLRAGRVVEPIKLAKNTEKKYIAIQDDTNTKASKFGGNRKFKG